MVTDTLSDLRGFTQEGFFLTLSPSYSGQAPLLGEAVARGSELPQSYCSRVSLFQSGWRTKEEETTCRRHSSSYGFGWDVTYECPSLSPMRGPSHVSLRSQEGQSWWSQPWLISSTRTVLFCTSQGLFAPFCAHPMLHLWVQPKYKYNGEMERSRVNFLHLT